MQDYFSRGILPEHSCIVQLLSTKKCFDLQGNYWDDRYQATLSDGVHYFENFCFKRFQPGEAPPEQYSIIRIKAEPRNNVKTFPDIGNFIFVSHFAVALLGHHTTGKLGNPTKISSQ
jgi:hypothetical protein